jgi:hypothetical protein
MPWGRKRNRFGRRISTIEILGTRDRLSVSGTAKENRAMQFGKQFLGLAVAALMALGAVAPALAGNTVTVTATVPATISVTVVSGTDVNLGNLSGGICTSSTGSSRIDVISNATWYGTVSVTHTGPALSLYRKATGSASVPGPNPCSDGIQLTEGVANAWVADSGNLHAATPSGASFFEGYSAIGGSLAGTTTWTLTYSATQS